MNLAEKLASTYLRLNGFLLLPHFTVFSGVQHNHVDLVALRAANSQEAVEDISFSVDDQLFNALSYLRGEQAIGSLVGLAAEVRTNDKRIAPSDAHVAYVQRFLGGLPVSRVAFFDGHHGINVNGNTIDIGMRYTGLWIQRRIDEMLNLDLNLNKEKSWTWSESFLADFLSLRDDGLLTNDHAALRVH